MYCSKCGTNLGGDSQFCHCCGAATGSGSTTNSTGSQAEVVYNHDVLVLHLRDLRFLEMARARLTSNLNSIDWKTTHFGYPINFPMPNKRKLNRGDFIPIFAWLFGGAIMLPLIYVWAISGLSISFAISILILAGCIVAAVILAIKCVFTNIRYGEEYESQLGIRAKAVTDDEARVRWENAEVTRLRKVRSGVCAELDNNNKLLKQAYDIDIIPSQFRSLYAVYFLYEFLSTSRETLSAALLHFDLNEIKTKLDIVIEQQQDIIIQQEMMLAQNQQIISQNEQMIKQNHNLINHAISIEQNTEAAAKYSKVAAINTDLIAFCAAAQFLRRM